MTDLASSSSSGKHQVEVRDSATAGPDGSGPGGSHRTLEVEGDAPPPVYRTYKRRWFGLIQLILLNIIVSWDWLSYASVANTAATFYSTTPITINWLSTAFMFAFVFAAPFTLYALHKSGPRLSIIVASVLILLGNWIRYGGTRAKTPNFGVTMLGQILIGIAQPFVLTVPTQYSELWFSPRGRVTATAITSLANPFGGALGQLISPLFVNVPSDIPDMILYIAIISSVATIPSFFIPAKPPTPVSPSSNHTFAPIRQQIRILLRQPAFWQVFWPFTVFVGFFNSFSSLLTQILTPYGFSETEGGIAGALLIVVGLVAAAIISPIVDRSKRFVLLIKILAPVIAISYLVFIWAPPSRNVAAPYVVCAVIGAASFSLLPVALEWLAGATWPVGPEVGSVLIWAGGQALGGIFVIISGALQDNGGNPAGNLQKALIFQAVVALAVVPVPLSIGIIGGKVRNRRNEVDKGTTGSINSAMEGTTV
ncbi:hypothetical protein MMC19_002614 [Ptychographa xylographoides]|nr:hypothetical protein [Ptychographa xylographoides]